MRLFCQRRAAGTGGLRSLAGDLQGVWDERPPQGLFCSRP